MTFPLKTFVVRIPPAVNFSAWPLNEESKHIQGCYVPTQRKLLLGGGDFTNTATLDSGNPMHWYYDVLTDTWPVVNNYCSPTGTVTPIERDESPCAYDAKRDIIWSNTGAANLAGEGGGCSLVCPPGSIVGSIKRSGTLTLNPTTKLWTQVLAPGAELPVAYDWHWDHYTDSLYANGVDSIVKLSVNPPTRFGNSYYPLPDEFNYGTNSGYTAATISSHKLAWDTVGRKCYLLIQNTLYIAGVPQSGFRLRFWSFNLDTGVYTKLPDPTLSAGVGQGECRMVFDTRNRTVLFPFINSPDGIVKDMLVFDTTAASPAWLNTGITSQGGSQQVRGNQLFYDPNQNVMVLGGQAFGFPKINAFFLYRYL